VDDTLRVGIVGPGRRGSNLMQRLGYPVGKAKTLESIIQGTEVVALCDTFERNLAAAAAAVEKLHDAPTLYRDYREMLSNEDLDAVIVATPDFSHAPIAEAAVQAGCDVYVEKCAANDPEQLRSLEAAMDKHDRFVQVGYQLRQDTLFRQALEVMRRGWIGEVHLAQTSIHRHGSNGALQHPILYSDAPPKPEEVHWDLFLAGVAREREYDPYRYFEWRKYWDYSNGVFGDNQSHSVDAVEFILDLGTPGSAMASGGVYHHTQNGRETPDVVNAQVEYPDKKVSVGYSDIGMNSYLTPGVFLFGTEGTMHVSWELKVFPDLFSSRYAESIEEGKVSPNKPMIHLKNPAAAKAITGNPSEMWLSGRGATATTTSKGEFDTSRLHLENFFQSVRLRNAPAASLEVTRTSTIAAMMSAESYRTGKRVTPADLGFE